MTQLATKSKLYLSQLCGLTKLSLVSESSSKITFKAEQSEFIHGFNYMKQQFGDFKAHQADTPSSEYQIDAVWTVAPGQQVIFVTDITNIMPVFFITLLNAPAYIPSEAAQKTAKILQGVDYLMDIKAWKNLGNRQNLGQSIIDIENEAKRLGLIQ